MERQTTDTVLVICSDEARAREILGKLFAQGLNVVGPAANAKLALALAAQSFPTVALVAQAPTGRRNASELAEHLMDRWGIGSMILDEAQANEAGLEAMKPWTPRSGQVDRLQGALAEGQRNQF